MLVFTFMNRLLAGSIPGLLLLVAFAGCGRESQNAQESAAAKQTTPSKAVSAEEAALKHMVSGVGGGKDDTTVDLKFELKSRPQIGQPLAIEVALLPKLSADTMRVTYISTDALAVQPVTLPARVSQRPGRQHLSPRSHGRPAGQRRVLRECRDPSRQRNWQRGAYLRHSGGGRSAAGNPSRRRPGADSKQPLITSDANGCGNEPRRHQTAPLRQSMYNARPLSTGPP